jgi:ABC-type antimicrobial peptide transport system permease subunit
MTFVVRGNGSIEDIAEPVRAKMSGLAPNLPLYEIASLEQVINDGVAAERLITVLIGLVAGIALLLAVVGVYSVMAYSVNQRTREIGVRVALGARDASVLSLVLRQGLILTATGIAVGLLVAAVTSRWLTGMLYQIGPLDPVTYGAVVSLLVASAMAASVVPAVRATRVDPLAALRAE